MFDRHRTLEKDRGSQVALRDEPCFLHTFESPARLDEIGDKNNLGQQGHFRGSQSVAPDRLQDCFVLDLPEVQGDARSRVGMPQSGDRFFVRIELEGALADPTEHFGPAALFSAIVQPRGGLRLFNGRPITAGQIGRRSHDPLDVFIALGAHLGPEPLFNLVQLFRGDLFHRLKSYPCNRLDSS